MLPVYPQEMINSSLTFLGVRHHCNYRLKVTARRLHDASYGDTQKEEQ